MSITRVQGQATNPGAFNNTIAATLASGATQGNLLVALISADSATGTWTAPARWSQAVSVQAQFMTATIFYLVVGASDAGATSFTWTLSASSYVYAVVSEWSSSTGWVASPLDKTASNSGSSTTLDSGTTATTTQANELWVTALAHYGTGDTESGLTAGWSSGAESIQSGDLATREAYQAASSTGAANAQLTVSATASWTGAVATFKTAAAVTHKVLGDGGFGGVYS